MIELLRRDQAEECCMARKSCRDHESGEENLYAIFTFGDTGIGYSVWRPNMHVELPSSAAALQAQHA